MSNEAGLRRVLLAAVALGCVGIAADLVLTGHTGSPVQWIPLALSAAGVAGSAAALVVPGRRAVWSLRAVGLLMGAGAVFGMYEHIEHNYAFEAEIRPAAGPSELLLHAITGGSPLLAPGAFLLVALLALGATWRHPATRISG